MYDTYSFEHLELFCEQYFHPLLCSNVGEHSCEHSYEVLIHQVSKDFIAEISIHRFLHLFIDMSLEVQLEIMFLVLNYLWGKIFFTHGFLQGFIAAYRRETISNLGAIFFFKR